MTNENNIDTAAIARSLDCITEKEFQALLGITEKTMIGWRQTGKAPLPVLIGNSYFYPLAAIKEEMALRTRKPRRKLTGVIA